MLRLRALLLVAAFVSARSEACESGGTCEEAKSPALLQQRHEDSKAVVETGAEQESKDEEEERRSTTTTFTMIGNISAKVEDLDKEDSKVDLELQDGSHLTFKQTKGYKRAGSTDTYVGDSADGKQHLDLVKQLKPGCSADNKSSACYDLFGSVVDEATGKVIHIAPNANGELEVIETNTSDYPEEAPPNEDEGMTADLIQEEVDNEQQQQDSIIDVLIVWTNLAECKQSRLSQGCTQTPATEANMRGHLKLAIDETNTAFELSGVKADLRLVHAYRDTSGYDESAGFSKALNDITNTGDGIMDDVHSKRQQYGADVVVLIISNPQYCGLAWMGPSKSRMFSVTGYNCATGYYSFGHEIAHNMGCNHDKGTSRACSSSKYNYGYRDPDANFRSIMGYSCRSGQCDKNKGGGCTRVQRFSNPNFKYNGKAIGTPLHDNARQLNNVRQTVAKYYTAPNPGPSPGPNPTTQQPATTRQPVPTRPPMTTAGPTTSAGPKPGPDAVACDFENGMCGWVPDKGKRAQPAWKTGSSTSSSGTGPQNGDHTPTGTKFAYLESSSPNFPTQTFNLVSRSFDAPSQVYVVFWYNMYGASMGKLSLELYYRGAWRRLWEMSGNKGDTWFQAWAPLTAGTTQLRFAGTTTNSYTSDFALDDISISTTAPTTTTTTTAPPTPTTQPPTPTTVPPTTQAPTQPPTPTTQPPLPTTTTTTNGDVIIPVTVNASEADRVDIKVQIVK